MKIVLLTGAFDPLHAGHIEYFRAARQLGEMLIVGVNSDAWLTRKKGKPFLPFEQRLKIIANLRMVDSAFGFDDSDDSARAAIYDIKHKFPWAKIIFANGGNSTAETIPEIDVENVTFKFGVGGTVSDITEAVDHAITEITLEPKESTDYRCYNDRSVFLYVVDGDCKIISEYKGMLDTIQLLKDETYRIATDIKYKVVNMSDTRCNIVELQHGIR